MKTQGNWWNDPWEIACYEAGHYGQTPKHDFYAEQEEQALNDYYLPAEAAHYGFEDTDEYLMAASMGYDNPDEFRRAMTEMAIIGETFPTKEDDEVMWKEELHRRKEEQDTVTRLLAECDKEEGWDF